jgi:hypothetical protein
MCGSERLKFRMVETKPTVQYPPLDLLKRLPLGSVDDVHVDRLTTLRAYFEQNDTSTRHDERNPWRARSRTPRRDCELHARERLTVLLRSRRRSCRVETMRYSLLTPLFAYLVVSLTGCGSSSSSSPSATSACTQLAAARCERVGTCNVDGVQVRFGDLSTCQAAQKAACMNGLAAHSTGATPASTIACAEALPSVTCTDYNDNLLPPACQVQVGKLAAGAVCAFSGQCQSQFCGIGKNAACGVCQTQPVVNDSCANLSSCGSGLACVAKGTVCASEDTKTGDMCDADTPCGAGFSCVGSKAVTATVAAVEGTCQPAVATGGATCDAKKKTGPGCDATKGLVCDPTSLTCIAIIVADPGKPCDGSLTVCGAASTCVIPTGATTGTCVAAAADGAACDTANGPNCATLSRCIVTGSGTSGTCELAIDQCGAAASPETGGAGGSGATSEGGSAVGGVAPI